MHGICSFKQKIQNYLGLVGCIFLYALVLGRFRTSLSTFEGSKGSKFTGFPFLEMKISF